MKTYLSKYLPAFVASLAVASGLQAEEHKSKENKGSNCVDLCYAGPNFDCKDNWEIMGAAVYQQVRVQGAEVAASSDAQARFSQVAYPVNATTIQQPEDFSWGFKVGAAYSDFIDDYRAAIRYSYFKAISNSNLESGYNYGFAPSAFVNRALFNINSPTGVFTSANSASVPIVGGPITGSPNYQNVLFQNLELGTSSIINSFQVTLERPSLTTQNLEMTPYYGVATSIITRRQVQVFSNDYFGGATNNNYNFYNTANGAFFQNYQKFTWWGVGPLAGLRASFMFGSNVSIYGDVYGALTYGQCSSRASTFSKRVTAVSASVQTAAVYLPLEAALEQRMFQFSPEMDFNIGIRWEEKFSDDTKRIRLQIGYEAAFYFQTMKTIVNDTLTYRTEDGAGLGIQGLVLQGMFDF
ncbi:MAG: hypothetical protein FJZ61_02010 [Chlamydiae bacterium]|nr:hypothetical protein [Chlamydiota bacterium]